MQVPLVHPFTLCGAGASLPVSPVLGFSRVHYHAQVLFVGLFNMVSGDQTQVFILARQVFY